MKSLEQNNDAIEYYKRRCYSILPTYWVGLIVLYLKDMIVSIKYTGLKSAFRGQCGVGFLRYVFGIQCLTPSANWNQWNNHSALWTMSSFFVFYIIAPVLKKYTNSFRKSIVCLIGAVIVNPIVIKMINSTFSFYPSEARIDLFASSNPLTTLYCFLFGTTLFFAFKEEQQFLYCFCLIVFGMITSFEWYQYEVFFTVFLCLACYCNFDTFSVHVKEIIRFISRLSFTIYLIHPILLELEPMLWNRIHLDGNMIHIAFKYFICIGGSLIIYMAVERLYKFFALLCAEGKRLMMHLRLGRKI